MPDPISFTTTSARLGLPFLFVAQAQKEFYLNEALARLDGLTHLAVEGIADDPPAAALDGEAWLIGEAPTGDWLGQAGNIALRHANGWLFQSPVPGMRLYDKAAGQLALFDQNWQRAAPVPIPNGGATQDAEARAAIGQLIAALVAAGVLA